MLSMVSRRACAYLVVIDWLLGGHQRRHLVEGTRRQANFTGPIDDVHIAQLDMDLTRQAEMLQRAISMEEAGDEVAEPGSEEVDQDASPVQEQKLARWWRISLTQLASQRSQEDRQLGRRHQLADLALREEPPANRSRRVVVEVGDGSLKQRWEPFALFQQLLDHRHRVSPFCQGDCRRSSVLVTCVVLGIVVSFYGMLFCCRSQSELASDDPVVWQKIGQQILGDADRAKLARTLAEHVPLAQDTGMPRDANTSRDQSETTR